MDISDETTRTYIMRTGDDIKISNPQRVGIKSDQYGQDSHVVWDDNGNGHYIQAGEWIAISWTGYARRRYETFGDRLNAALEAGEDKA